MAQADCASSSEHNPLQAMFEPAMGYPAASRPLIASVISSRPAPAEGGAEGVGKATMTAVVGSCLSILMADYFLAIILFQIIFKK